MSQRAPAARPAVKLARWRITSLLLAAVLCTAGLAVRLVELQVLRAEQLAGMARREIDKPLTIRARRGTITDSEGNVLALDVERESLYAIPPEVNDAEKTALVLAPLIRRDASEILQLLRTPDALWVPLASALDPAIAEQIDELVDQYDLRGLRLQYEPRRIYPQGSYAAHVLGFINAEGSGVTGVEASYDELLRGEAGQVNGEWDPANNPIWIAPQQTEPAQDGASLRLTIDPLVQHVIESELEQAVKQHNADGGTIIVLDPQTGAILGMASYPVFDPNHFARYSSELIYRNPAITDLYEPGSTFKIFTVAAGLQSRAFTADTQVHDTGTIWRYDTLLRNWNAGANGMLDSTGVLYYSSNVGALQLNEITGEQRFYAALRDFGFGTLTGVDLPAEAAGLVNEPGSASYTPLTLLTNAFGQGISVTPLQLVRAVAVIANGGNLVQPYIVAERCKNTICTSTAPRIVHQAVEPGVAWTLRRMLSRSSMHYAGVVWGPITGDYYGDQFLVPGYEVAAKTGTSQIPLPSGGYDPSYTIGSVAGFGPSEEARFAVLVKIDRPKDDIWGVSTAIPVFQRVMSELLRHERIQPDPGLVSPGQQIGLLVAEGAP